MKTKEEALIFYLRAALEWIDAVPEDLPLPSMPGFDRDEAERLVEGSWEPDEDD